MPSVSLSGGEAGADSEHMRDLESGSGEAEPLRPCLWMTGLLTLGGQKPGKYIAACVHGVGRKDARIRLEWAQPIRGPEVKGKR